nr:hypothetical protein [Mesorhizobium temperatum]
MGERTRIINRIKAVLAWLGIRGFNPKLRRAVECLDALRDNAWCAAATRLARLEQAPVTGPHAMVRLMPASSASASRPPTSCTSCR